MAYTIINTTDTLEQMRVKLNNLTTVDFGDPAVLSTVGITATSITGAVVELADVVFSAAGFRIEDSSSSFQEIGAGETLRVLGTENQINARDCMNDMGPDSCFQSPNMFQSLENGGVNSSASILKDGLNENNIGQLVREDFKCPRLVADTPPLEPLFINAPSTPDQTQYDITHLPCRGCTTDTCVNCHEHNDLFI